MKKLRIMDTLLMLLEVITTFSFVTQKVQAAGNFPETGDSSNIFLYVGIFAASVIAILVLLILNRRKNK
ncbi:MAG: LPXTG cell wall anchor domain-containing protein [Erysipelotrichaceae bacterium]|nr:LPXTG cell wall anchor domain-containing protein [Erysipelotrichaceae bacterium]